MTPNKPPTALNSMFQDYGSSRQRSDQTRDYHDNHRDQHYQQQESHGVSQRPSADVDEAFAKFGSSRLSPPGGAAAAGDDYDEGPLSSPDDDSCKLDCVLDILNFTAVNTSGTTALHPLAGATEALCHGVVHVALISVALFNNNTNNNNIHSIYNALMPQTKSFKGRV